MQVLASKVFLYFSFRWQKLLECPLLGSFLMVPVPLLQSGFISLTSLSITLFVMLEN